MKKYVYVKNGKEVRMDDKIFVGVESNCGVISFHIITINEESIPFLIEEGFIIEEKEKEFPTNIDFYLEHLAKRINWNVNDLRAHLVITSTIYPAATFSILLKEISMVFNEKYQDHLENSEEIYIINVMDGEIGRIRDMSHIKSFKNFAAFRTKEDAIKAKNILKDYLKPLFKKYGE